MEMKDCSIDFVANQLARNIDQHERISNLLNTGATIDAVLHLFGEKYGEPMLDEDGLKALQAYSFSSYDSIPDPKSLLIALAISAKLYHRGEQGRKEIYDITINTGETNNYTDVLMFISEQSTYEGKGIIGNLLLDKIVSRKYKRPEIAIMSFETILDIYSNYNQAVEDKAEELRAKINSLDDLYDYFKGNEYIEYCALAKYVIDEHAMNHIYIASGKIEKEIC